MGPSQDPAKVNRDSAAEAAEEAKKLRESTESAAAKSAALTACSKRGREAARTTLDDATAQMKELERLLREGKLPQK